jgi:GT2 family glycosyltransferase
MINWFPVHNDAEKRISIMIPTWNNLEMLKLCVSSLQKNSALPLQIIIHVNEGTDGTLEWVKAQKFDFTHSKMNIGVCWAMNACRALVKSSYIVFLNDDMYMLPGWDIELMKEIETLPDNFFYLSSTTIEPRISPHPGILAPYDFGDAPENFREEELLKSFKEIKGSDWSGATWPPSIIHVDLWDLIGGYSVEFFPGLYSDPDFSMKLFQAGVRYFKGVDKSRVYHFGSKSTRRIRMNKGSRQFLNKWGITSSVFSRYYLKRGMPFKGKVIVDHSSWAIKISKVKSCVKRIFLSFSGNGLTNGPHSQ